MEGNQQKIRYALETLLNLAWVVQDENRDCWTKTKVPEQFIIDVARSALSEPARNCDRYDNKTDAETAFVEETGADDSSPHYWQMFANWLFWKEIKCQPREAEDNTRSTDSRET